MTLFVLYHSFLFVLLEVILICDDVTVEAHHKNDVAVPGWFNSIETYVISSIDKNTESTPAIEPFEENAIKTRKKAARKKRKKIVKKVIKRFHNGEPLEEIHETHEDIHRIPLEVIHETHEVKYRRKKKKKNKRKFMKAETNTDSNLSGAHEGKNKKLKNPVDIVVHIKMDN